MVKAFIEIKNRIILFSVTSLSVFFLVYYYKTFLLVLTLTSNPIFTNDILKYFIFTSISELFSIYITLTFFITRQILFYIFVYHFICFFSSGLYKKEYFYLKKIFFLSMYLNIISVYFFFAILIPIISFFFLSFQEYSLQSISFYFEAKISDYLIFFIELYLNCFFSFQCCLFIILLSDFTTKNVKLLKIIRKYLYLLILILSTLTTPPDIFSQLVLFITLVVLLEIQILYKILKKNCKNLIN